MIFKFILELPLLAGKTSIISRIFGTVDTDELREERASVLEQKIEEHKASVSSAMEQRE